MGRHPGCFRPNDYTSTMAGSNPNDQSATADVTAAPQISGFIMKMAGALLLLTHTLFVDALEVIKVRYPVPESEMDLRYEYPKQLLKLALEETLSSHGAYEIEGAKIRASQTRNEIFLRQGFNIDIIWRPENGSLDENFLPIRIPILKGALGYRVFLIRQSDQGRFHSIKTLNELKTLTAGFGHDWPDVHVLRANNIPLELTSDYEALFKMLITERFDYFPRGINEAWDEYEQRHPFLPELKVEDSILMYYPLPVYFVVNKSNKKLAQRVEVGLQKAIANGGFDQLFFSHHQSMLERANLSERKLFILDNPFLPESTPKGSQYWLKVGLDQTQ
ncbi:conserved hypothetical protein [Hahella chejuensis KCTC 2396]|uniref:ABC-type amino acid transport/signal transduction systems, periplasmic component/domain n=1 Tax=Hahella chejuensis (strain KCTC 2396) TaxID=349521 RepID=Q2SKX3_HAHCH|nr:hypothetical protein [Hahella chejuensis]ABC28701.1 conserved hypothetical protein [Hahella chejuensis KCTC 2396]